MPIEYRRSVDQRRLRNGPVGTHYKPTFGVRYMDISVAIQLMRVSFLSVGSHSWKMESNFNS